MEQTSQALDVDLQEHPLSPNIVRSESASDVVASSESESASASDLHLSGQPESSESPSTNIVQSESASSVPNLSTQGPTLVEVGRNFIFLLNIIDDGLPPSESIMAGLTFYHPRIVDNDVTYAKVPTMDETNVPIILTPQDIAPEKVHWGEEFLSFSRRMRKTIDELDEEQLQYTESRYQPKPWSKKLGYNAAEESRGPPTDLPPHEYMIPYEEEVDDRQKRGIVDGAERFAGRAERIAGKAERWVEDLLPPAMMKEPDKVWEGTKKSLPKINNQLSSWTQRLDTSVKKFNKKIDEFILPASPHSSTVISYQPASAPVSTYASASTSPSPSLPSSPSPALSSDGKGLSVKAPRSEKIALATINPSADTPAYINHPLE